MSAAVHLCAHIGQTAPARRGRQRAPQVRLLSGAFPPEEEEERRRFESLFEGLYSKPPPPPHTHPKLSSNAAATAAFHNTDCFLILFNI